MDAAGGLAGDMARNLEALFSMAADNGQDIIGDGLGELLRKIGECGQNAANVANRVSVALGDAAIWGVSHADAVDKALRESGAKPAVADAIVSALEGIVRKTEGSADHIDMLENLEELMASISENEGPAAARIAAGLGAMLERMGQNVESLLDNSVKELMLIVKPVVRVEMDREGEEKAAELEAELEEVKKEEQKIVSELKAELKTAEDGIAKKAEEAEATRAEEKAVVGAFSEVLSSAVEDMQKAANELMGGVNNLVGALAASIGNMTSAGSGTLAESLSNNPALTKIVAGG